MNAEVSKQIEELKAETLYPTGFLVELALRGVQAGLLDDGCLELASQALQEPNAPIPAAALELAAGFLIFIHPQGPDEAHNTWSPSQRQWRPLVEQSLAVLMTQPQPPEFWEGAAQAARMLQPVHQAQPEAGRLVAMYHLSQGSALPDALASNIRERLRFRGDLNDIKELVVGLGLGAFGYGVMQLCRYAHRTSSLQDIAAQLEGLRASLEQEALRAWVPLPLAQLPRQYELGCANEVRLMTAEMATQVVEPSPLKEALRRVLLEGTETLCRFVSNCNINGLCELGYALHNHPSMLTSEHGPSSIPRRGLLGGQGLGLTLQGELALLDAVAELERRFDEARSGSNL